MVTRGLHTTAARDRRRDLGHRGYVNKRLRSWRAPKVPWLGRLQHSRKQRHAGIPISGCGIVDLVADGEGPSAVACGGRRKERRSGLLTAAGPASVILRPGSSLFPNHFEDRMILPKRSMPIGGHRSGAAVPRKARATRRTITQIRNGAAGAGRRGQGWTALEQDRGGGSDDCVEAHYSNVSRTFEEAPKNSGPSPTTTRGRGDDDGRSVTGRVVV